MSENQPETAPDRIRNGASIRSDAIVGALTRAPFAYTDGTAQMFTADGRTTFTEKDGTSNSGEWGVDENGRFWSFWPPSYRAEYDLFWIVDHSREAGVRFVELRTGTGSEGCYAGL